MSKFYKELLARKYPYIIADIGMSHEGNMSTAMRLIDELVTIGCDAVKFQSWTVGSLYAKWAIPQDIEKHVLSNWCYKSLRKFCGNRIAFSSSVFSTSEVDQFRKLKVPFFKVASMDLNNPVLLKYVAEQKKPIILSTGMGTMAEIDNALNTITKAGNDEVVLMHCVSLYPPQDMDMNLKNIPMLREAFGFPVGFSDHTEGVSASLGAIALGACIIEKHYPAFGADMEVIIGDGRILVDMLGSPQRKLFPEERRQRLVFRRSIVTARAMQKGEYIHKEDIAFKRPGTGIPPDKYEYVLGKKLKEDLKKDEQIPK